MTAVGVRDALLQAAEATVAGARRDGLDPLRLTPVLQAAWAAFVGPTAAFDDDFHADPATGVEALAFVVADGGGLVLRLPGELPDSFEPVALPRSPCTPAELRAAWFATPT
jgi:hypothetical protein